MKPSQTQFVQKKIAYSIHAALLSLLLSPLAQAADDPTVAELTQLPKEIEIGATAVSNKSYKFGEYNGLEAKGGHATLGFKLGGKGDEDSTLRWKAVGENLGLATRRIEVDGGQQGVFSLHFLYDEIPHNISDTYQTIFNGAGTTRLSVPANYPPARLSSTTTAANSLANWNNIQAPDAVSGTAGGGPGYLIPSLMHNENIGFKRTKIEGGASVNFLPGWEAKFTARQENKDGTKLTGYAFNSASTAAMLVEPLRFKTTGFDAGLGYAGDKANFNASYSYSVFKNDIGAWTADTPFAGASVLNSQALLSSAPENRMQQLRFGGGYRFTQTTRLSYEASKTRMAQDNQFNCQVGTGTAGCVNGVNGWLIPVTSPNAKNSYDLIFVKLTARPLNNLNVSAGFKRDRRDNQTPINSFKVSFADSAAAAGSTIVNDPINWHKNILTLDADYAFARAQAVKLAYQRENVSRSTDGSGLAPSRTTVTANTNDFTLPVHRTKEDTWRVEYRNSMISDLTARVSYARSSRTELDYSQVTPAAPTTETAVLTNAHYQQFRDFFVAARTRDKIRSAFNYQLGDAWSLGFAFDYNRDQYKDAAFRESKSKIYNFDLTYTASEDLSLTSFYSLEDRASNLAGKYIVASATAGTTVNGVAAVNSAGAACNVTAFSPCILANWDWSMTQADKVHTLGFNAKHKGLMANKLEMNGDLLFVNSATPVTAGGGGTLTSDGAAAPNYLRLAPADYPKITSRTTMLRVSGTYKIDPKQSVRLSYLYQHLRSNDWQYDAYTNPIAMQAYIGTGMTAPRYNISVVGASYVYSFK